MNGAELQPTWNYAQPTWLRRSSLAFCFSPFKCSLKNEHGSHFREQSKCKRGLHVAAYIRPNADAVYYIYLWLHFIFITHALNTRHLYLCLLWWHLTKEDFSVYPAHLYEVTKYTQTTLRNSCAAPHESCPQVYDFSQACSILSLLYNSRPGTATKPCVGKIYKRKIISKRPIGLNSLRAFTNTMQLWGCKIKERR